MRWINCAAAIKHPFRPPGCSFFHARATGSFSGAGPDGRIHVSWEGGRRNNCEPPRNHFSLWRRQPETSRAYPYLTDKANCRRTGDREMRRYSFILALGLLLAGPSMAGSVDSTLPGTGAFSYNGTSGPVAAQLQVATNR
jgi:hypothetical protein